MLKVYKASEYFASVYALLGINLKDDAGWLVVFDKPLDNANYKLEFKLSDINEQR
jgi:hypothetical protein